jgi:hypothetical protein
MSVELVKPSAEHRHLSEWDGNTDPPLLGRGDASESEGKEEANTSSDNSRMESAS